MVHSQHLKKDVSVVRVIFEFYPFKGGSITHLIELSKKINPYLKSQMIIAPDFGKKCESFDNAFGIPIIRVKYPRRLEFFKYFKIPTVPFILFGYACNVIKVIKKNTNKDTLIHVHGTLLGAILVNLLKIFNLKTSLVISQDSGNLFKISKRSALSALLSFILFKFAKPKYLLIADDGMGIRDFVRVCEKYKISFVIVGYPIDSEFFKPDNVKDNSQFIVLSTSRLDTFKRVDLAILGFRKFLELVGYKNNVRLIIVGSGSEYEKLVELVRKEEMEEFVEFLGEKEVREVRDHINRADVIVGTSLKSNFNRSIQEAMACKKPVIVFDSGEIEKLVKHMENGLLAKSGDVDAFAQKLKLLYNNPKLRERLGKNARETILRDRIWDTRIKKDLKLYERVLKEQLWK